MSLKNGEYRTRFAPSPTGPLHLGHAFSALTAAHRAEANSGACLLRIEDIDHSRARPEWEALIYNDLAWLGLSWPTPVRRQSDHRARYWQAIKTLSELGLVYPCRCTRADLRQNATREIYGPDGLVYPGTCRNRGMDAYQSGDSIRLNMEKTLTHLGIDSVSFHDTADGQTHIRSAQHLIENVGDIVLWRRQADAVAYHLAVVVDDADQGITEVVRGMDLFEATAPQIVLQKALSLPTPHYHHHRLITDQSGKRLAKTDKARALQKYRQDGLTPADIRDLIELKTS